MRPYFTRERFGRPQFLAGLLLLTFLAQAAWLVHAELHEAHQIDGPEALRVGEGWKQWHGQGIAGAALLYTAPGQEALQGGDGSFDAEHSPLLSIAAPAPL